MNNINKGMGRLLGLGITKIGALCGLSELGITKIGALCGLSELGITKIISPNMF